MPATYLGHVCASRLRWPLTLEGQEARSTALEAVLSLAEAIEAALLRPEAPARAAAIEAACGTFDSAVGPLLPQAYPSATLAARARERVRLSALRVAGAEQSALHGDSWAAHLWGAALPELELAVTSAIDGQPGMSCQP